MPSKQFEHMQEESLRRLRLMVPSDCPLLVQRVQPVIGGRGAFRVQVISDHGDQYSGRFEVVTAWIAGYVAAWSWSK